MSILSLLKIEFTKQKKNFILKLTFITPILCFFMLFVLWSFKRNQLMSPSFTSFLNCNTGVFSKQDALFLTNHLTTLWFIFSNFTFSFIALSVNFIEHNENCWKYFLCLPINRTKVYFSKWLFIFILSLISIVLNAVGFIIISFIFGINNNLNYFCIFKYISFEVLCSLSIISFQHFISCYFKNLLIPLSIWIIGILISITFYKNTVLEFLIPYIPIINSVPLGTTNISLISAIAGTLSGLIWLLIGIIHFNKKDIK